jgi:hypothetical protein
MMFIPHRKHTHGNARPPARISFTFLYVDDVRTSQETYLWISTACCGDNIESYFHLCLFGSSKEGCSDGRVEKAA